MEMNLKKYDRKHIQIIDNDGTVYEGIGNYNDCEYCYHEYGRNEECLDIFSFLFYKSDIKKIISLDNNNTLYGKFNEPYGEIEKIIAKEGTNWIEDALESEEDEHVYRLLLCIEDNGVNNEIINLLKKLIKYNENEKIIKKAKEMIERSNK